MSHQTLAGYYKLMFAMVHHHKYSIQDIESMIPFERDLFSDMIVEYINEQPQPESS